MQFNNNDYMGGSYYSAMDRLDNTSFQTSDTPVDVDPWGNPIIPDDALNFTPREVGTATNPMGNTLDSLKERIRQGVSRIELGFIKQGKGNSQQPTPESFGAAERQDMRELLKINEMKTSTHAAVHGDSLAGFTENGFSAAARANALKEIKKAIDFAGEASKGGAVVFHLTEWGRPLSDIHDPYGKFKAYDEEDKDAAKYAVDDRNGKLITEIKKDKTIYRPKFITADDKGLVGKTDANGKEFKSGDWVDINGNKIDRFTTDPDELFNRMPDFDKDRTRFKTEELQWDDLVREAKEYEDRYGKKIAPEVLYAQTEIVNRALQAKGSSLFYARDYDEHRKNLESLKRELEYFKHLEEITPEEEKWKLKKVFESRRVPGGLGTLPEHKLPSVFLEEQIKHTKDSMRHIHEASASADAQAQQFVDTFKHVKSVEKYGLDKTAETIAKAGITAMETYNRNKDKYELTDPIYVAPENWDPRVYGSHPSEYKDIIKNSRDKMAQMLMHTKGLDKEDAEEFAKKHIRGTLDVGHLNLFRSHFERKEGETTEQFEKRFNKWILDESEKLVKEGYVDHIHLTDNFGFDDEHLTPGQGNVPMKEFLKRMQDAGVKDLIVEQGSYNIGKEVSDTLAFINSPVYGVGRAQRFSNVRNAHFGYNAPGFFIAGAYSPSNDWRPWTEIPLE